MNQQLTVAVTGANGYLGGLITEFLYSYNINCIKLVRKPCNNYEKYFALGEPLLPGLFTNVDVLIHAAHDFSLTTKKDNLQVNFIGAVDLFKQAHAEGVKSIIFISSMSSFKEAKSLYGQTKFLIEQEIMQYNGYIIRPGLIYGISQGGMMAKLSKLANLPVLPYVHIEHPLYLCHYMDLLALIHMIVVDQCSIKNVPIIAANPTAFNFKQILEKLGAKRLFPLPWQPIWLLLKLAEKMGVRLRTGSDNLISLVNQPSNPDFSLIKQLNCSFREFD